MSDPRPTDLIRRFLMRAASVRGETVALDAAWREVVSRHDLPVAVRERLGELTAAGLLLAASLKFDGQLVLQVHGDGPVALMVAECAPDGTFRSTVKIRDDAAIPPDASLQDLVNVEGRGRFAVTLVPNDPEPGQQPYQGVVPFDGTTIAEVLERYMARSEQLPTRLWVAADDRRATGLLLQRIPTEGGRDPADADGWDRMQHLAGTLRKDELLELSTDEVLHRLFWEETLEAFDGRACRFHCTCSREKVAGMLKMLGRDEVESVLAEMGTVAVRCEFCNSPYVFDPVDCARLFVPDADAGPGSDTRH